MSLSNSILNKEVQGFLVEKTKGNYSLPETSVLNFNTLKVMKEKLIDAKRKQSCFC